MPVIVENKLITLNSLYSIKQNGTLNSSVLFNFKGILVEEDDIVSSNICVMNAQIPVSFYVITATSYITTYAGVTQTGVAVIQPGNYNFNALKVIIDSQFATQNIYVEFLLDKATGKVSLHQFSGTTQTLVTFVPPSIGVLLGWGGLGPYTITGSYWLAPYPMNLLGVKKLNIQSQKLQISSFTSTTGNLGVILCTIPVDVPAYSMINYTNQTDLNKSALQTKVIDQIDISITDEANNLIDFHNIDWSITLVLENIRHLPERFTPGFRELTTPIKPPDTKILETEPINDVKELELLSS